MEEPEIIPEKSLDPEFLEKHMNEYIEFAKLLKQVYVRLIMEGYVIEDGKIYKPEKKVD